MAYPLRAPCLGPHASTTNLENDVVAKTEICSHCGYTGTAKKVTKGSTLMELVLWLCFIIPGLLYSMTTPSGAPSPDFRT